MVKTPHPEYAFSEIFYLEASPVEGQSLLQKIRKGEIGKVKKLKTKKSPRWNVGHSKFLISVHVQAKML